MTYKGSPAPDTRIALWFYDGTAWAPIAERITPADGSYLFDSLAGLSGGQAYAVLYANNIGPGDPLRLSAWYGPIILDYASGANRKGGDFDVANVTLLNPPHDSIRSIPITFTWQPRGLAEDEYRWALFDVETNQLWETPSLGNAGAYLLSILPQGVAYDRQYGWFVRVYSGDNGFGESFYYHGITFSPIIEK